MTTGGILIILGLFCLAFFVYILCNQDHYGPVPAVIFCILAILMLGLGFSELKNPEVKEQTISCERYSVGEKVVMHNDSVVERLYIIYALNREFLCNDYSVDEDMVIKNGEVIEKKYKIHLK